MATLAFIDASNLFYGGEKSLGWKIDYEKLASYLKAKYDVSRILYFGGVEIYTFQYDYVANETVPLEQLERYLCQLVQGKNSKLNKTDLIKIKQGIKRIRFYIKIEKSDYELHLKPVKLYDQGDGTTKRKANCDVDIAFYLMREQNQFDRVLVLSGDGDFLPVLKHLRVIGKEVIVLSRGQKTAREIKRFAGADFKDFTHLKSTLQ